MEKETLCWNCKNCTNKPPYICEWVDKGIPVNGWIAEKGLKYEFKKQDGSIKQVFGYMVESCPKYVKELEFHTRAELAEIIGDYFNILPGTVFRYWENYLKKYENVTKIKIPSWAYEKTNRSKRQKKGGIKNE